MERDYLTEVYLSETKRCKLSFSTLQQMYYNAMWAAEMANANGSVEYTLRYYKIANRIETALWNFQGVNLEKK